MGDGGVKVWELSGAPYNTIDVVHDIRRVTGLSPPVIRANVRGYRWDRERTIKAAVEYLRGELPQYLELKPKTSVKRWLTIRQEVEAEPDTERYKCKKVQLYLYRNTRSTRFRDAAITRVYEPYHGE
jgi:hypothetical protein